MMAKQSLSVYREFLRSIRKGDMPISLRIHTAFRNDAFMQQSARNEVRSKFEASAGVSDHATIDKLCAEGRDAAKFLTQYVVQAELNERGNYAMSVEPHHTESVAEEAALRPGKPK